MSPQNTLALTLKSLHQPSNPLILANVWDAITARTIGTLPQTKALATASAAIAAAAGLDDDDLTLEVNLRAIAAIAKVAHELNKPLTIDFQDGFGDQLEAGIKQVIELGAVGINLEDLGREVGGLYDIPTAQDRIRRVLKVAKDLGVPDFCINARTDSLWAGQNPSLDEAIERGKAYLDAGAHNVFIWGGPTRKGWSRDDVQRAVRELDGRLNVILVRMKSGGLSVAELREIGVARISLGPQVMMRTQEAVREEARAILEGEGV